MPDTLMDALLLSQHCFTRGLSREGVMEELLSTSFSGHTHTQMQSRDVPPSPGLNMNVCSGFMAAVVTGRYTTSGHLTSVGIRVGGGPCESRAIWLRILLSQPPPV